MNHYRKILLIADPSMRRSPALRRAMHVAASSGAELHWIMFEHQSAISAVGAFSEEVMALAKRAYLREREEWLSDNALSLREDGLHVKTEVVWGTPLHEKIIDKVVELQPDLVIKDVHLEPALRRLLYTPLDWQLLRLCPTPLLLVNGSAEMKPRRLVAAVDPVHSWHGAGALNERIVRESLALAIQCDAQVHLVHAYEGLPSMVSAEAVPSAVSVGEVYEQMRQEHAARFTEFSNALGVPPDRRHMLYGEPAGAIAEFASSTEADVVVLGTVYRTGLERIVMGSTAERILDQLQCDVLAIKPEGFADALRFRPHTKPSQIVRLARRQTGL